MIAGFIIGIFVAFIGGLLAGYALKRWAVMNPPDCELPGPSEQPERSGKGKDIRVGYSYDTERYKDTPPPSEW